MRFTVSRESFLKPLKMVASVVERRHTQNLPILSNVLIKISGSEFQLTTTDQEVELISNGILEEAFIEGAVTVPVRKLMDVCRALPENSLLSFEEETDRLIIRGGRSRFTLSTLSALHFPNLEGEKWDFTFTVLKQALRLLIEQTGFAMAEQDVRYYLNGMLLEVKKGILYAVAADGHRLAVGKMNGAFNSPGTFRIIVPRKGVLELSRLLDDKEGSVTIMMGGNHIRVVTDGVTMTSKLLEGRFPDYERIIPANGDKIVLANRELLKEAFLRSAALFSDKFRGVRLHLSNGCLKILASNAEQDEVEEDIEVDYQGRELEIGFNVKYLIDLLGVIETHLVKFIFSDSNSSVRVEGVDGEGGVYVIMPMKI